MATIRDELEAWGRTHIQGANVMTKNQEAYNHMQAALAELLQKPWVNLVINKDMQIKEPQQVLDGDRNEG